MAISMHATNCLSIIIAWQHLSAPRMPKGMKKLTSRTVLPWIAINAAIETWNPKKTSLSTWIRHKVRYLVADIRRTERNYWKTKKDFESGEAISEQKVDRLTGAKLRTAPRAA